MRKKTEKKHSKSPLVKSKDGRKLRNHSIDKDKSKLIDEKCYDEKALMEAVFDSVPGMLYLYTEDGRLIQWNKRHEDVTGYTSEELLHFRAEKWFDEEDRIALSREWPKVFSEGYNEAELNLILKDGRRVPYFFTAKKLMIDGKPHMVGIGIDMSEMKKAEEEKAEALEEIKRLKELLEAENIYLKKVMKNVFQYDNIIGQSDAIKYVLYRAQQVAQTETTVLIVGETGTGKGMIARFIHQNSPRKDKPFVIVNCAVLPGNLIESELFGREKGAFTGAEAKQIGRFELANGGTIFLDEIAELPVELQAKLLRVIEDGEFERLGSPHAVKVDVRIIASTNRNLKEEISKGRFREDLFFRLNIFPITIPPLRQRKEDIPLLAKHFMEKYNKQFGKNITDISEETERSLQAKAWPGNIRELMGVIENAMITTKGSALHILDEIDSDYQVTKQEIHSTKGLADMEKDHIVHVLNETGWKIEGPNGAAKLLGLHPSTLRNRIKKLSIEKPAFLR